MSTDRQHLPTYPDLANKVAVGTGGSREIGAAAAHAFATSGGRVALNGREQAAIDNTVDQIRSCGQAVGVAADCTVLAHVERVRSQVEQALGAGRHPGRLRRDRTRRSGRVVSRVGQLCLDHRVTLDVAGGPIAL